MTWWVPVPDALNRDPRARVVSRAARGVLAQLLVEARGVDVVPYVNHHDGRGTIAVIAWCEGDGPDACAAEARELTDAGLVSLDDDARVIRLHLSAQRSPSAAAARSAPEASPPARRVKPSDTPERIAQRKARHALKGDFAKRAGACAEVPAGVTWEAWLATEAGAALHLARVGVFPGNAPEGVFQNAPGTPPERPRNALPPSPHTPLSSPKKETEGEAAERPRNASTERPPGTPPERPRCATVEALSETPPAAEVLLHLRGSGKLRLSVGLAQELELSRVLGGVTPAWSAAGVQRLAQHIGAGHLKNNWRPHLDDLRGRDGAWSRLLTLYDEAQDCPTCRQPPRAPSHRALPPRAPEAPALSAAERIAAAAPFQRKAAAADAATHPEEADPHG